MKRDDSVSPVARNVCQRQHDVSSGVVFDISLRDESVCYSHPGASSDCSSRLAWSNSFHWSSSRRRRTSSSRTRDKTLLTGAAHVNRRQHPTNRAAHINCLTPQDHGSTRYAEGRERKSPSPTNTKARRVRTLESKVDGSLQRDIWR